MHDIILYTTRAGARLPVILLMALYAGCAGLKTGGEPPMFQRLDQNGDGRLTDAEFSRGTKQVAFEAIDRDGDGLISKEEWMAAAGETPKAREKFRTMDRDQDNKISFIEFSDAAKQSVDFNELFTSMDQDRDGIVTPSEFKNQPAFKIFSVQF